MSLVLNVGKAHLGEFGSQEGIAQAKGEIVEALGEDGIAVLNADDPLVAAMAAADRGRVLTFGDAREPPTCGSRTSRLDDLGRPSFTLRAPGDQAADVAMRLVGEHHAGNAAAAAAVALAARRAARPTSPRRCARATADLAAADGGAPSAPTA